MKPFPMEPGRAVLSKAGRDAGIKLAILSDLGTGYVAVADGRLRKVASPKKKKTMHLRATRFYSAGIVELYRAGRLLDADVRRFIDSIDLPTEFPIETMDNPKEVDSAGVDSAARKEEDAFG